MSICGNSNLTQRSLGKDEHIGVRVSGVQVSVSVSNTYTHKKGDLSYNIGGRVQS